ncbi:hypothetical protein [Aquimarina algiphila]|uniref:hypothetical protein n=1 Tax=Aquimarina algiphila TaxID=2047982 RepID=UPI002491288F|nr:hypothetical protein [Aquimarina algiphila]
MKIRSIVYIIFLFVLSMQAQRQSILETPEEVTGYHMIPQEKMFIHYNTSLLFVGEYLYYNVYNFTTDDNLLSSISKIAYVVLVNEKGKSVFKHKIKLDKGLGQGDFFVPVSIPSGNYKLIGYTQWMLNTEGSFFEGDISILNPYQVDQDVILSKNDSLINPVAKELKKTSHKEVDANIKSTIKLSSDYETYKKRTRVELAIENESLEGGTFSISVRRKEVFKNANVFTSKEFLDKYTDISKKLNLSPGSSVFLPEMRGELIYGKIIPKEPSFTVSDQNIALSMPGKSSDIKIVSTDKEGNFVFNLNNRNIKNEIWIEVFEEGRENYNIVIDEIPEIDYKNLEFYKFKISKSLKDYIEKRSVHNQIETNFYSVKPDTIKQPDFVLPFYGNKEIETYVLDDYTRFKTVRETILEIVDGVWIKKDNNNKSVFGVRTNYPEQKKDNFPLLLIVDDVIVQHHEDVIAYSASKIKSIGYIKDRYYLGTRVFDGVIIIKTIEEDFFNALNYSSDSPVVLADLQDDKQYFGQQYDKDKIYSRIPDYRYQLLWRPNFTINKKKTNITFFTSDVVGDFEVSLEGFTTNGIPVSIKKNISVE